MIKDILTSREEKMQKTLESLKREFASLRAGRATPSLLDKVMVDYYGTPTPVNQVAKVSVQLRYITAHAIVPVNAGQVLTQLEPLPKQDTPAVIIITTMVV